MNGQLDKVKVSEVTRHVYKQKFKIVDLYATYIKLRMINCNTITLIKLTFLFISIFFLYYSLTCMCIDV